jgi:hypothetical protein
VADLPDRVRRRGDHRHGRALLRLPFYAVFAAVFGAVAYLTGSILPGVVVHAAVDVLLLGLLVGLGRPAPPPLVWVSGPDPWFWAAAAEAVLGLAVAVRACRSLAAARRRVDASAGL